MLQLESQSYTRLSVLDLSSLFFILLRLSPILWLILSSCASIFSIIFRIRYDWYSSYCYICYDSSFFSSLSLRSSYLRRRNRQRPSLYSFCFLRRRTSYLARFACSNVSQAYRMRFYCRERGVERCGRSNRGTSTLIYLFIRCYFEGGLIGLSDACLLGWGYSGFRAYLTPCFLSRPSQSRSSLFFSTLKILSDFCNWLLCFIIFTQQILVGYYSIDQKVAIWNGGTLMICTFTKKRMIWMIITSAAADLFDDDVDLVSVLHVQIFGGLRFVESFAVEKESYVAGVELNNLQITLWRWQQASMSFFNWVVLLILKKTYSPSWLLTLRLSCSVAGAVAEGSAICRQMIFKEWEYLKMLTYKTGYFDVPMAFKNESDQIRANKEGYPALSEQCTKDRKYHCGPTSTLRAMTLLAKFGTCYSATCSSLVSSYFLFGLLLLLTGVTKDDQGAFLAVYRGSCDYSCRGAQTCTVGGYLTGFSFSFWLSDAWFGFFFCQHGQHPIPSFEYVCYLKYSINRLRYGLGSSYFDYILQDKQEHWKDKQSIILKLDI